MEEELIKHIAKSLVANPDAVVVNVIDGEGSAVLELTVDENDLGKVIGKHGRVAKAIRTILQAANVKSGKHIALEILD
ncbi:MAG: KH domain-containing protein [Spirochaetaceae bacterium]|nr:KH domain-containing protein [Spirochaetaceae bacterium]